MAVVAGVVAGRCQQRGQRGADYPLYVDQQAVDVETGVEFLAAELDRAEARGFGAHHLWLRSRVG